MTSYGENALVSGLTFLAEKQASIANNLANVSTTSFKRRAAMAQDSGDRFNTLLDNKMSMVGYSEHSDMTRGSLRETGNQLNVAIDGPEWMRVQNAEGGEFYTRNGQLNIALDGHLTTRDGLHILGRDGSPILLGSGDSAPTDLTFSPNGTITDKQTGQTFGPMALVALPEPEALVPVGRGLYTDPKNQTGKQGVTGLQQGFIEGSNVDSMQELVAMITVERSFSATQKALTGIDRLQGNLISNMLR
ncbi:MAG: flagellar basal body rod protein FlgG [Planctomycetota bacterium]|jgi:flagellar basal body rod protein FlgG